MRKKDDFIHLTGEQKKKAVSLLKEYLLDELDLDAGNLQTEIFLDFITKHIGIFYYNKAIADALGYIVEKAEDMYILMKEEDCN